MVLALAEPLGDDAYEEELSDAGEDDEDAYGDGEGDGLGGVEGLGEAGGRPHLARHAGLDCVIGAVGLGTAAFSMPI